MDGCLQMVLHVIVAAVVVIVSHCGYFCGDFGSLWYCDATVNEQYKRYLLVREPPVLLFTLFNFLSAWRQMYWANYLKNQL